MMSNGKIISEISEQLLFPHIFKAFRIAIQPSKLLTAFMAVAVLFILGWIMDTGKTVVASDGVLSGRDYPTELHCFVNDRQQTDNFIKDYRNKNNRVGFCAVTANFYAEQFNRAVINVLSLNFTGAVENMLACVAAAEWAFRYHIVYSIVFSLAGLVVISIAAGAICRGAALQFALDEKPGFIESLRFSIKNFKSFFMAAFAPAGVIIFFGVCVFLFGLLFNIPFAGELIVAVTAILLLLVGLMSAIVTIGAIAGAGLMFPVIAYENSDNYDAISRSFSYICSRPWRIAGYTIVAAVYGSICYLFVRFVAFLSVIIAREFTAMSIWTDSAKTVGLSKIAVIWSKPEFFNLLGRSAEVSRNATESIAAVLIYLSVLIVSGIIISFIISFYFSANSIIYALMRKAIDRTPLNNVYVRIEEVQQKQAEQNQ